MPIDRFLIAPYDKDSGLDTSVRPWLIPDNAFSTIENAYVYRGRIRKRFGSLYFGNNQYQSRFRISIDTTDGSGNINLTLAFSNVTYAIGQLFTIGTTVFTVVALGTPADMLRSDGSMATATFNTTTGEINIVGAPANTTLFFYPALPVMGLLIFENSSRNEPTVGFDTVFSYKYTDGVGWDLIDTTEWSGNDDQFFWSTTWIGTDSSINQDTMFVTNNNPLDGIKSLTGGTSGTWSLFQPQIDATPNYLITAQVIVVFKNRLVALNTWEGPDAASAINFPARMRWSAVGSPFAMNSWRQDIPGNGNALDNSTTQELITAEFVKDRLIVYFDRSTWEVVYTGNQVYPFIWQQINTELGAESTFSIVPFDKVAIGIGNNGIHACNGIGVERIDTKIPQLVFGINNLQAGVERVYGVRDYYVEMVYWTYPATDASADFPYPNRVLVYDYKTGTWATNMDSITVFGYFQPQSGITWDSQTVTWDDDIGWDSGTTISQFRQVVAGNQQGFTFVIDPDVTTNAPVLQITNIATSGDISNVITITCINHNLREGEYILIQSVTNSDGNINLLNVEIFQVTDVIDADNFSFEYEDEDENILTGTYTGGGTIARVSNINLVTKQYNFYAKQGKNAAINKIDFMVDKTGDNDNVGSQIQVEFYISTSQDQVVQNSGTALVGTSTLDMFSYADFPYEKTASRIWRPVYFQANGEVIQFQLTFNDAQMRSLIVMLSDFQLHAMCIYATPTSSRFQ